MSTNTINPDTSLKQLNTIRFISSKDSHIVLDRINKGVDWELLAGSISDKINNFGIDYKSSNLVYVLKALTLEILFDIQVHNLNSEITDRKSYQKFLCIHNFMEIPSATLCSDIKNALYDRGLYENIINIIEIVLTEKDVPATNGGSNGNNIDRKIDQLEERVKEMHSYDKIEDYNRFDSEQAVSEEEKPIQKYRDNIIFKQESDLEKSRIMTEKLKEVNEKIDKLLEKEVTGDVSKKSSDLDSGKILMEKLQEINDKLQKITTTEPASDTTNKKAKESEDVYKKLFDSFYNQLPNISTTIEEKKLSESDQITEEQRTMPAIEYKTETKETETDTTTEKLSRIEEEIKKLYAKLSDKEVQKPKPLSVKDKITGKEKLEPKIIKEKIEEEDEGPENEIDLKKKKRYHIFNNTNLTEDYELGLRFYKLGFKTAFINMKANERDENSRIATAEYFPNSFWGSVKQRSRWIAGIVFQNWKIHKWQGNFKTKYFLLRDRKALFSFFGIFLSNIVFAFFVVYMLGLMFNFFVSEPIVQKGSVLWYLMIATLFFLINRVVHRFAATYNWYGFKYAAMSIVRLLFDNLINLFATMRAIRVYNTNKKQIVWDSTDHY